MQADDAAADDRDLGRQHARHAAEQDAEATIGLLQRGRPRLDRQASGDLRHRRQQRQAAALVGHRLIGDRGDAGGDEALGLFRIRRQMQIGVEKLAVTELRPFGGLRLLHLDDHVALFEDILGGGGDLGAGRGIGGIISADTDARLGLHPDLVAVGNIFAHRSRRQADAIFMILDFLRATDTHARSSHFISAAADFFR